MKEILSNEILAMLIDEVDGEHLQAIRMKLSAILAKYEVTHSCTDLTIWQYQLPECYKHFMVAKKIEGTASSTLKQYKRHIEKMLFQINKPVQEISKNDILAHLYRVQTEGKVCNRTLDNCRSAFSSFFSWASAEGYIEKNPMVSIKPIKFETKEVETLSADEMECVRMHCKSLRDKAIVEMLYSTACRVSELASLNISDVNFEKGTVKLFGKGSKHRTSYLSARAKSYLLEYLKSRTDDEEALFVSSRAKYCRLKKSGIERVVKLIGKEVGFRLHPHLFRHTSATDALAHGMDITQVQQILGHASLDTTMIYARVNPEEVMRSHTKYVH